MVDGIQWQINASLAELEARHQGPDAIPEKGTTTLMIRNMPRSYTAEAIMCELKTLSPRSNYDFVYLPWDTRRGSNISYAFLNFADHESSLRAFFALSGRMWSLVRTMKTCRVATAHIQGLAENLANYVANSGIQDDCPHAPTVFHNGKRLDLRLAVRLFCTGDMLQRAAEAARASKLSMPEQDCAQDSLLASFPEARPRRCYNGTGANIERLPTADGRCAIEFRHAFQQFCQSIAQNGNDSQDIELDGNEDIPSNVQFWLRFRELCLQFSASSSVMPEFKLAQAMAPPSQASEDRIAHVRATNGAAPLANSLAAFASPHPPGLIRSNHLSEDLGIVNRLPAHLEQVVAHGGAPDENGRRVPCENGEQTLSERSRSDPCKISMPDEGLVPVPKLLMNGSRSNRAH
mmetsp:Transcript_73182/g.115401  ORF Transcript_73182/g.115401 Transcript_73182/m.115401 type:complete len:405 (-) Transcript_73182:240-1454(-)|eukprot:CAMPEP_0169070866 /NCGR_PEP_ID=MMETSP1015-20121227/5352_1 /TAXON_ID=342587 /ORGANISM="Karlodinium micrum, Strain CCMP2283" /LENGTH=404 /DNA_ID=CAMNT_0009129909 /DNA_START=66 /DNA_END=1280 /DNA_ORIENTATION=-